MRLLIKCFPISQSHPFHCKKMYYFDSPRSLAFLFYMLNQTKRNIPSPHPNKTKIQPSPWEQQREGGCWVVWVSASLPQEAVLCGHRVPCVRQEHRAELQQFSLSLEGLLFPEVSVKWSLQFLHYEMWVSIPLSLRASVQVDFDLVLSKTARWPQRAAVFAPVVIVGCLNVLLQADSQSSTHWPISVRGICIWDLFNTVFWGMVAFCKSNSKYLGEGGKNILIKFLFRYRANSINSRWSVKLQWESKICHFNWSGASWSLSVLNTTESGHVAIKENLLERRCCFANKSFYWEWA